MAIFDTLQAARRQIIEDIKADFQGVPLSVEHYILAEHRLQSMISAGLLIDDSVPNRLADIVADKKQR